MRVVWGGERENKGWGICGEKIERFGWRIKGVRHESDAGEMCAVADFC